MDIVQIVGGLGNQMFGYAFALSLASHKKKKVSLCLNYFLKVSDHNGYELKRVFNVKDSSINRLAYRLISTRKIKLSAKYTEDHCYIYDSAVFSYHSNFLTAYYMGYWQNERYFTQIEETIRSVFTFDEGKFSTQTEELAKRIKADKNSVSIHIRRGDYCKEEEANIHGNLCPIEYYKRGIEKIRSSYPNASFYVFSDEPQWVAENFTVLENATYINWNKGLDSWQDMALMSYCSHHITANSSFSWWGAWLARPFEGKIVIAPVKWLHTTENNDIVPKRWTML